MSKKALVALVIVAVIVLAAAYWWFHPPINIHSVDTWMFVAVFILLPTFLFFRAKTRAYKNGTSKVSSNAGKAKAFKVLSFVPVVVFALVLVGTLMSVSFFPGNAQKYASVLQTTDMEFTQDIQEVDYNEIPVIDRESAVLLGNRTMGAMSDLREPVRDFPLVQPDQLSRPPGARKPLGVCRLVQMARKIASRAFPPTSSLT